MSFWNYRNQTIILGLWIVVIICLFKFINSKEVASVFAGVGFIVWPTLFLIYELTNKKNKIHLAALLIFLCLSALPIFLMRIFNWGTNFSDLSLLGIPMEAFHRASNGLYILMLVSSLSRYLVERRKTGLK